MGQNSARISDPCAHGGKVVMGSSNVKIGGQPASRKGDAHTCPIHGPGKLVKVSSTVFINGVGAARKTDMIQCKTPPSPASGASVQLDVKNAGSLIPFDPKLDLNASQLGAAAGPFKLDASLSSGLLSGKLSLPGGVTVDLSKGSVSVDAKVGGVSLDANVGAGGASGGIKAGNASLYVGSKGGKSNAHASAGMGPSAFGKSLSASAMLKSTSKSVGSGVKSGGGTKGKGGKDTKADKHAGYPPAFQAFKKESPKTTGNSKSNDGGEQAFDEAKQAFEMLGAMKGDFTAGPGLNVNVGMGKSSGSGGGGGGADLVTQGCETVFIGG